MFTGGGASGADDLVYLQAMQSDDHAELLRLLRENTALAKENNILLRKLRRSSIIELWLRVVWFALLIGLPFALYFYILEPYFEAFGGSFDQFRLGIEQLPGIKGFEALFNAEQP